MKDVACKSKPDKCPFCELDTRAHTLVAIIPNLRRSGRLSTTFLRCQFASLNLVNITPDPGLSRLDRAHERVLGLVEMLGGVFILRRIAARDVAAEQAHAQMNPRVARLNAVFTNVFFGFAKFDLVEVGTFLWHRFPSVVYE
jgi:hypothetical protein